MNRSAADQQTLFAVASVPTFSSTRFQGSKAKLVDWIWESVSDLRFDTVLDAFAGTGAVSYLFKSKGKAVTYNDNLAFNYQVGLALIENDKIRLQPNEVNVVLQRERATTYPSFIADSFKGIYFLDEENRWLDTVVTNLRTLDDPYKKAIAYFAIFQAAIAKRPYNLFHRKNLYMRTSHVRRSFGNKATWDKPFDEHFRMYVKEANDCLIDSGDRCRALNSDVLRLDENYDLVYIDPPYVSKRGVGVDYRDFYHFLEGLVRYHEWASLIEWGSKNRRLVPIKSQWTDKATVTDAFEKVCEKFHHSKLVVSYRADGIPSEKTIVRILESCGKNVRAVKRVNYKYVLSPNGSQELLFVAT